MIFGIGIDIVKIDRIREAHEKWGMKLISRILTPGETEYCFGKKDPYPSVAVRFAAKEALIKAIGSEVLFSLQDAEVISSPNGRPSITVHRGLEKFFTEKGIIRCHLSMSHEKEFGIAYVVLEDKR